jgi:hypothetical protein
VASDEVSVASGAGIALSATSVVADLSGAAEISSASAVLRGSESISMYSGDSASAVTEDVSLQAGAAARIFAATDALATCNDSEDSTTTLSLIKVASVAAKMRAAAPA